MTAFSDRVRLTGKDKLFIRSTGSIAGYSALSYGVDYSFQLIDIFWVAQLGTGAATSIAIVSAAFFLLLSSNEIVGASSVPIFSQAYGSGDKRATAHAIRNALLLKFVIGVVSAILFGLFLIFMVNFITDDVMIKAAVRDYGAVIWVSLILMPLYATMMTGLRVLGKARFTSLVSLLALLANALLNPILIFGYFGGPALGIVGAAWATVGAQILALIVSGAMLIGNRQGIRIIAKISAIDWPLYRRLLTIGLPIAVVIIIYNLEQGILAAIAAQFPAEISDGYSVGARIFGLFFMINFGLSLATAVSVGHYIGARKTHDVMSALPKFTMAACGATACLSVPVGVMAPEIASLFIDNPQSITTATIYLRLMMVANLFFTVFYCLSGAFEGAGINKPLMLLYVAVFVLVELPLLGVAVIVFADTLFLVWVAALIAAAVAMGGIIALYRRGLWIVSPIQTSRLT